MTGALSPRPHEETRPPAGGAAGPPPASQIAWSLAWIARAYGNTRPDPAGPPSYHDLHVTTPDIARASIFNLPYGVEVRCCRVGGWQVWDLSRTQHPRGLPPSRGVLLGGEYDGPGNWLVLDVAGHVIADSRPAWAHVHGTTHRHPGAHPGHGPAWREHSHLGGGAAHAHDPGTDAQVPADDDG